MLHFIFIMKNCIVDLSMLSTCLFFRFIYVESVHESAYQHKQRYGTLLLIIRGHVNIDKI